MEKSNDPIAEYRRKCRLGKARFVPAKRTALDGIGWWCVYDKVENRYVPGVRRRLRREAEAYIAMETKHGRLPPE